uniref:Uncharacterized protein n=1 Tax=Anopheles maculatus TaxID=74869 RepID=A0A182SUP8_9DIPT
MHNSVGIVVLNYVLFVHINAYVAFVLNNSERCPSYWGNNLLPTNDISFQGSLTYVELNDVGLEATDGIDRNNGLCMKTFVSYAYSQLNVTIVCNESNSRKRQAGVLHLRSAKEYVKYILLDDALEILICEPSSRTMGGLASLI